VNGPEQSDSHPPTAAARRFSVAADQRMTVLSLALGCLRSGNSKRDKEKIARQFKNPESKAINRLFLIFAPR
jgi:hypothetical protein